MLVRFLHEVFGAILYSSQQLARCMVITVGFDLPLHVFLLEHVCYGEHELGIMAARASRSSALMAKYPIGFDRKRICCAQVRDKQCD